MLGIVGLGGWQVSCGKSVYSFGADNKLLHLRSFFKRKYLID